MIVFRKVLIYIFLITLLITGIYKTSFADEIVGIITKIEDKRITVQGNIKEVTLVIKSLEGIKVGNYVKVIYYPLADLTDIFGAEEIQVLQAQ
jgi:hypothetical protein